MVTTAYRPRILWLSTNPKALYSFSQQSEILCAELARRGYEIHYLAAGYRTKPYVYKGFKVYPIPAAARNNHFSNIAVFREYIKRLKPDLMISLTNTRRLGFLLDNGYLPDVPWIHWTPAESDTPLFALVPKQKKIPYYLGVSAAGIKSIIPYQDNIIGKIYHAVNDQDFYPLPRARKLKIRRKYGLPLNAFVIGTVSTTSARKQPFRLFEAFVRFSKSKKNTYLVWYADFDACKRNSAQFMNVRLLLRHFYPGWRKRIILIHSSKPIPAAKLNEIYNLFDVFALATAGEGFGIPIAEAMFCKVPAIATDYSAIPELIGPGCGWLVRVKDLVWGLLGPLDVQGALIDIDDLARIFEEAYKFPKRRKAYGNNAYQRAKTLFAIKTIADQWEDVIDDIFKKSKTRYKQLWRNGLPNSRHPAETFLEIQKWICSAYIKQENWGGVLKITRAEEDISLLSGRGYALAMLKQYKEAEECYKKALKLKPGDSELVANLQNVSEKQKNELAEIFGDRYEENGWREESGIDPGE